MLPAGRGDACRHITKPKEVKTLYLIQLPEQSEQAIFALCAGSSRADWETLHRRGADKPAQHEADCGASV